MNVPAIQPLSEDRKSRPFWSVMIPAYNPNRNYLEQALSSVLAQDPGPEQMQIEVVDDCSSEMDVAALVKSIAGSRVKFSQTPKNLGLAGCFNACIERSRGEWIHILHQDDWVLPSFYARFEALIRRELGIGAAYSRYFCADADGHYNRISSLEMKMPGELPGFAVSIAIWQCVQCAAVIVKRSTYERLGGYRTDIPYVLDWEMWCRIAASGRWGYVPQPGAVYRYHLQSETERLRRSSKTLEDFLAGGRTARAHFPGELQDQTASSFENVFASYMLEEATTLYMEGSFKAARRVLDTFRGEALKSNHRWAWLKLRFRVFIKPLRQLFSHG
jgi:glycosyltransferase involved in cell wall biosynthesis